MKILIAEDESALRYALEVLFQRNKYTVDAVDNGRDALLYLQLGQYDAAVLDVMMPEMDGITVLRRIRGEGNRTPVLLLTAKAEIEDRVEGLDAGANDYLPKPFDVRELLARVRVLTRSEEQRSTLVSLGNTELDTKRFLISGPLGERELANKEFQTLLLLFRTPGSPVAVETLLRQVWEADSLGQENALWTVIYNLRKKLGEIGSDVMIQNKRNLGYVLEVRG